MKMNHAPADIIGRIMVSGTLINSAPLKISSGEGSQTDSDLILDGKGLPYIPGTSWTGAIRDHFSDNFSQIDAELKEIIFGTERDKPGQTVYQSALITYDLPIQHAPKMEIRTSTSINHTTGTAEDKSLHDFEILAAGNMFDFGFELVIREAYRERAEDLLRFVKTLIHQLQQGRISVGGKTGIGFGKLELSPVKWKVLEFPRDAEWWLTGDRKPDVALVFELKDCFEASHNDAVLRGRFYLNDSLMVKQQYSGDDENIDSQQMRSAGKNIIPGSSIRGVFRHRARKILNTLGVANRVELENDLFGMVDTGGQPQDQDSDRFDKSEVAIRGKLTVSECVIQGGVLEKQSRIRLDQFTGGVMNGALFSELPLWSDGNTYIELYLRVANPDLSQIGLLLLVIKDLWMGELALGGGASIGRGKFTGTDLSLDYQSRLIQFSLNGLSVAVTDTSGLMDDLNRAWQSLINERLAS